MTVEVTVQEERLDWLRERFDFIQSKMDVLGPLLGKAYLRDKLKILRHVVTVAVRDMPKVGDLYALWSQPVFDVGNLVKNIEFPSSYKELSLKQLKYILEFPERFRASAKDRKGHHPDHIDLFRAKLLRERQTDAGEPDPLTQPQVFLTEKEVKRAYKKYVKEWKEDHD